MKMSNASCLLRQSHIKVRVHSAGLCLDKRTFSWSFLSFSMSLLTAKTSGSSNAKDKKCGEEPYDAYTKERKEEWDSHKKDHGKIKFYFQADHSSVTLYTSRCFVMKLRSKCNHVFLKIDSYWRQIK